MVTLLFYHSPIFSLIMIRVEAEDKESGWSIGLFSCFLLAGGVVWGRILRLLCPGGAPIAVLWMVLERLISLEVQPVKLLISNNRHVVWHKGGCLRIGEQEIQALGWALARRTTVKCCSLDNFKSLPIPFSIFPTVPWEVPPMGDPIEIDSSVCRENDQMRAGPPKSQWRG
jgi:hypothetical protein